MEISERIKNRRIELGMTQEELARKVGYTSKTTIAKIESNANQLRQSKIAEIAKALDVTPSYIMGWSESDPLPVPEYIPEIQILTDLLPQLTQTQRDTLVQTAKVFAESNRAE